MFRKGDEPIPGYRLEKFLGKGQFGEVWRTTAPGGTAAALKFIDLGGKQGVKEFRGVRRVKEIRHANLMPIIALWMLDGEGNILGDKLVGTFDPDPHAPQSTLVVSETGARPEWLIVGMLLGKKNLANRLEECQAAGHTGIPVNELLRYMEEAAKGIDYLNAAEHDLDEGCGCGAVQHCDIKPANIMLIGDSAVVCDFGLARVLSDSATTTTGMVGSPAYMAPECIARKPGPASDQYSLAVSYVELRTGQLPFKDITYLSVLEANRSASLELSKLSPLEQQVIRKATSLRPEDRYRSTLEMVRALQKAVDGKSPTVSVPSWLWVAAAILVLLALPAIVWVAVAKRGGGGDVAETRLATVLLTPADAEVKIAGELQKLDDTGKLTFKMRPGDQFSLEATHPDQYAPLRRQLTWEQLSAGPITFALERNAQWHSSQASARLGKGDRAGAIQALRDAMRLDPTMQSPVPIELKHHGKAVRILAMNPVGNWFGSAADDGAIGVWSLTSNGPDLTAVATLKANPNESQLTESMDVSPDGRWLVAVGRYENVIAWNLTDPKAVPAPIQLMGHKEDVTAIRITPDRKWLVTAGFDSTVRLWPMRNERPATDALVLQGHSVQVEKLNISPDSKWLVSSDIDNKIFLWDLKSATPETSRKELPDGDGRIRLTAISPDGTRLVAARERQIASLRLDQANEWQHPFSANETVEFLAFNSAGDQIYVGDEQGEVARCDFKNGEIANPQSMHQHAGVVSGINISKNGAFVVTSSWDNSVGYWRTAAEGKLPPLSLPGKHGPIHSLSISPDDKWIIAGCEDGTIVIWDAALCDIFQEALGNRDRTPKPSIKA